jgi:hypothetical protein
VDVGVFWLFLDVGVDVGVFWLFLDVGVDVGVFWLRATTLLLDCLNKLLRGPLFLSFNNALKIPFIRAFRSLFPLNVLTTF